MNNEAEEFLGIKPTNENKLTQRRSPIFGIISVIAPFLGYAFAYVAASNTSKEGEGWGAFAVFVLVIFLSLLFGLISSIVGLVRSEKPMFLPLIGLFLNLWPILWLLKH
jgi:hypothetical protein